MNRNPILIRNIEHLTDARYFAAMGVDWLSMTLTDKPKSFAMWHTLSNWIAGVKLAAEINSDDEMLLAKAIIDAKPEGIVSSQNISEDIPSTTQLFFEVESPDDIGGISNAFYVLPYATDILHKILSHKEQERMFLESDWTTNSLEELLKQGYKGGICFSGGEEVEVGMRDYDLMDDLLELLQ